MSAWALKVQAWGWLAWVWVLKALGSVCPARAWSAQALA